MLKWSHCGLARKTLPQSSLLVFSVCAMSYVHSSLKILCPADSAVAMRAEEVTSLLPFFNMGLEMCAHYINWQVFLKRENSLARQHHASMHKIYIRILYGGISSRVSMYFESAHLWCRQRSAAIVNVEARIRIRLRSPYQIDRWAENYEKIIRKLSKENWSLIDCEIFNKR